MCARMCRWICGSSPASFTAWSQRFGTRAFERVAKLHPGAVETREVELPLRREVPVENRLRHRRLARDVGGRRPGVAARGEDALSRVDDRLAPLGGGQAVRL